MVSGSQIYKIKTRLCHIKNCWQSLITVLHICVLIMLKCICMQNFIKIYHAVQELRAFSLKDLDPPK